MNFAYGTIGEWLKKQQHFPRYLAEWIILEAERRHSVVTLDAVFKTALALRCVKPTASYNAGALEWDRLQDSIVSLYGSIPKTFVTYAQRMLDASINLSFFLLDKVVSEEVAARYGEIESLESLELSKTTRLNAIYDSERDMFGFRTLRVDSGTYDRPFFVSRRSWKRALSALYCLALLGPLDDFSYSGGAKMKAELPKALRRVPKQFTCYKAVETGPETLLLLLKSNDSRDEAWLPYFGQRYKEPPHRQRRSDITVFSQGCFSELHDYFYWFFEEE